MKKKRIRSAFFFGILNLRAAVLISLIGTLFFTLPVFAESKVEYEGEQNGLIAVPDNFFSDFGEMMPGDKKEETVVIRNKGENAAEFFFRTKLEEELQTLLENGNPAGTSSPKGRSVELLKKARLTIWMEKESRRTEIYHGNLAATTLKEGVSLGKYRSGEEGNFMFSVEIPKELGNVYASNDTDVIWVFSVKVDSDTSSAADRTTEERTENKKESETPKKQNSTSPNLEDKRESSPSVVLGIEDYSKWVGILLIISGSLIGIGFWIKKKK